MKRTLITPAHSRQLAVAVLGFAICFSSLLMLSACSVDSADSVIRSVDGNVNGVYRNDEGEFVSRNSGAKVTQLDLRQDGDQLQAIDNNGIVFRGTIGNVVENIASFNLDGSTTAGNSVTISGNIEIGGGEGIMRATWIESAFFSTVFGRAIGPSQNTNVVTVGLSISPSGPINVTAGSTRNFTASGGSGTYTWSLSSTNGTLNTTSGSSVTYSAATSGAQTLTVSDGSDTDSVSIN